MTERRPRPALRRRAAGAAVIALGCGLFGMHSPAAWSLTVNPSAVNQGDAFTIDTSDTSGFTVDGNTKALIWGGGPYVETNLATPSGRAYDVAVNTVGGQTYAYVADGNPSQLQSGVQGSVIRGGLQIVHVVPPSGSTPGSADIVGAFLTGGQAQGVTVSGQNVFVAEGGAGLDVVSVADPTAPALVRHVDLPDGAPINNVAVNGNYAYLAVGGGQGLRVVDLTTLNQATVAVTAVATASGVQDVTVSADGKWAYLAEGTTGIQVFDTSSPAAPAPASPVVHTQDSALQVALSGSSSYVFVADRAGGLQLLNVSAPAAPFLVTSTPPLPRTPGLVERVAVSGNIAYVADYAGGLRIYNVSDPTHPQLYATLGTPWPALSVAVGGSRAYVAVGDAGLQVVNIPSVATTGPSPMILGGLATAGETRGVALDKNSDGTCKAVGGRCYAYVADGQGGLRIADVSSSTAPAVVAAVLTPDMAEGVTLGGSASDGREYAYVADRYRGLQIVDVTDPTAPSGIVGSADTPGRARDVDVLTGSDGNCLLANGKCYAYVADMQGGLQIVDVTRADAPVVAASVATPRPARAVRVLRTASPATYYAFVVAGINGLQVIEVDFPPDAPVAAHIIAQQQLPNTDGAPVPGVAAGIAISRDGNGQCKFVSSTCYAYVAVGKFGLEVFDITRDLVAEGSDTDTQDTGIIPSPLAVTGSPVTANGVALSADGTFAYVTYVDGVTAFDLTAPAAPMEVAQVDTPGNAQGVAVAGHKVYVADTTAGLETIPAAVYATVNSFTSSSLSVNAVTYLSRATYDVTVVNLDGTLARGRSVLTLNDSAATAGIASLGLSPINTAANSSQGGTAQSTGGGTLVGDGAGTQTAVGQARTPSLADAGGGAGGGGGAAGPGLFALLLLGWWGRLRRRSG